MDAPPIQYCRTADGVNIAYWTLGEGHSLMVLRQASWGDPASEWAVEDFRRFYELLAQHFRVIRVFTRGTGPSGPGELTQAAVVADLDAVIKHERAEPLALCTTALGFQVASAFLSVRPTGAAVAVALEPVTQDRWERTRRMAVAAEQLDPDDATRVAFYGISDRGHAWREATRAGQAAARRGGYWDSLDTSDVFRAFETNASQIRIPVLVVDWTGHDGHAVAALIPGSQTVTRRGPEPFLDAADDTDLVRVLTDFIDAHLPDGAVESQLARSPRPSVVDLSPRELEVVALVAAGQTNAEVAAALIISSSGPADRRTTCWGGPAVGSCGRPLRSGPWPSDVGPRPPSPR